MIENKVSFLEKEYNFPAEMLPEILQHLDLSSLKAVSRVNKYSNEFVQENYIQPFKTIFKQLEELGYHVDPNILIPHLIGMNSFKLSLLLMRVQNLLGLRRNNISKYTMNLFDILVKEHHNLSELIPLNRKYTNKDISKKTLEIEAFVQEFFDLNINKSLNPILLLNSLLLDQIKWDFSKKTYSDTLKNLALALILYIQIKGKSITALAYIHTLKKQLLELSNTVEGKLDLTRFANNLLLKLSDESEEQCYRQWLLQTLPDKKEDIAELSKEQILNLRNSIHLFIPETYKKASNNLKFLSQNKNLIEMLEFPNLNIILATPLSQIDCQVYNLDELCIFANEDTFFYCKKWLPHCQIEEQKEIATMLEELSKHSHKDRIFPKINLTQLNFQAIKTIMTEVIKEYKNFFNLDAEGRHEEKQNFIFFVKQNPKIILHVLINFFLTEDEIAISCKKMADFCQEFKNCYLEEYEPDNSFDETIKCIFKTLYDAEDKCSNLIIKRFPRFYNLMSLNEIDVHQSFSLLKCLTINYEFCTILLENDTIDDLENFAKLSTLLKTIASYYANNTYNIIKLGSYKNLSALNVEQFKILMFLSNLGSISITKWVESLLNDNEKFNENKNFLNFLSHSSQKLDKIEFLFLANGINQLGLLYFKNPSILMKLITLPASDYSIFWLVDDCLNEIKNKNVLSDDTLSIIEFFKTGSKQVENINILIKKIGYRNLKNNIHFTIKSSSQKEQFGFWHLIVNALPTKRLLESFLHKFFNGNDFDHFQARNYIKKNISFFTLLADFSKSIFLENISYLNYLEVDHLHTIYKNTASDNEMFRQILTSVSSYQSVYTALYVLTPLTQDNGKNVQILTEKMNSPLCLTLSNDWQLDHYFNCKIRTDPKVVYIQTGPQFYTEAYKLFCHILDELLATEPESIKFIVDFLKYTSGKYTSKLFNFILEGDKINKSNLNDLTQFKILPYLIIKPVNLGLISRFSFNDLVVLAKTFPLLNNNNPNYLNDKKKSLFELLVGYNGNLDLQLECNDNLESLLANSLSLADYLVSNQSPPNSMSQKEYNESPQKLSSSNTIPSTSLLAQFRGQLFDAKNFTDTQMVNSNTITKRSRSISEEIDLLENAINEIKRRKGEMTPEDEARLNNIFSNMNNLNEIIVKNIPEEENNRNKGPTY